jgi:hypothetical protein
MKIFPIPVPNILPVAVTAATLDVRQSTAVAASTTRYPVVAPAGTVLRVWLHQTPENGPSQPGDRFSLVLSLAFDLGSAGILPMVGFAPIGALNGQVQSRDAV